MGCEVIYEPPAMPAAHHCDLPPWTQFAAGTVIECTNCHTLWSNVPVPDLFKWRQAQQREGWSSPPPLMTR